MEASGEFGFAIDCNASTMKFTTRSPPLGQHQPWDWPLDAPLTIVAKARPFDWADAWRLPSNPIREAEATGPEREITRVPYGNTKVLRISMFPYLS